MKSKLSKYFASKNNSEKRDINITANDAHPKNSSRIIVLRLAVVLILVALAIHRIRAEEPTPLQFHLTLSPNTTGTIDGSASLSMSWNEWASTSLVVASDSFVGALDNSGVEGTTQSTTTLADLTFVTVNQNLLWDLFKTSISPLTFSIGMTGRGAWIKSIDNGYTAGSATSFFAETNIVTYFRPMATIAAGLRLGALEIAGNVGYTPVVTYDFTDGTIITSSNPVASSYTSSGSGFDAAYGGSLSINTSVVSPRISINYAVHIGATRTNRTGVAQMVVSQREDVMVSGRLGLNFLHDMGTAPYLGASWIDSIENVVDHPELGISNTRFRFDVGMSF